MGLFMTDEDIKGYEKLKDIPTPNKLAYTSGVGIFYGKPASRKSTIAINTIKSANEHFNTVVYMDLDSKSKSQVIDTYKEVSKLGWKYVNGQTSTDRMKHLVDILDDIPTESCVIVDTWHELLLDENDNKYAKLIMREVRKYAIEKNILVLFIAHSGKHDDDIRGASSVTGSATFKVFIEKSDIKNEYICKVTKDSLGQLVDCTAVMVKSDSTIRSVVRYTAELKEKTEKKPKQLLLQNTMIHRVDEMLKNSERYNVTRLLEWLYDNHNRHNKLSPTHELFTSNRFIRDNFTEFCNVLFDIYTEGRRKYIVGIKDEYKVKQSDTDTK